MTVWTVPAIITRVVDGDTVDAELDLGWHITYHTKVRLSGCNAPEMPAGKTPDPSAPGIQARIFTSNSLWNELADNPDLIGFGAFYPVTVVSHSLDKYGRVLGAVKWTDRHGVAHDLTEDLLAAGHAVPM